MNRKSPVRHEVKKHYRQGKLIDSFPRGSGKKPQRSRKKKVVAKPKPGIPFKIKITYSKYEMKTEYEVLTEGMARGMGYRSRERTMKIRVTIPWLKWEYSQKIDDVMAGILFYPTKRHKREREESAHVYLRETSTLHSGTQKDRASNLAEYTRKVRRVLDKLYDEEKEWEPVAVREG